MEDVRVGWTWKEWIGSGHLFEGSVRHSIVDTEKNCEIPVSVVENVSGQSWIVLYNVEGREFCVM